MLTAFRMSSLESATVMTCHTELKSQLSNTAVSSEDMAARLRRWPFTLQVSTKEQGLGKL